MQDPHEDADTDKHTHTHTKTHLSTIACVKHTDTHENEDTDENEDTGKYNHTHTHSHIHTIACVYIELDGVFLQKCNPEKIRLRRF